MFNDIALSVLRHRTFNSKNRIWEQTRPLFVSCADQVELLKQCWKLKFLFITPNL